MIIFSQVKKRVNEEITLKNMNFLIKKNDFVFIKEKNREVMKTITLLLSGRLKADYGLIKVNYIRKTKNNSCKDISIVHFDNIFLKNRNIEENLRFVLNLYSIKKYQAEFQIKRCLNIVDLKDYNSLLVKDLLPQQKLRLSIARSLLLRPSIIILEDPIYYLDEVNSQAIFHLLKKINKLNITIIFICSNEKFLRRHNSEKTITLNREITEDKKEESNAKKF
ncbi:MAG: hypothetical protein ACQEQF_04400 [Bacillota bacterium]